MRSSPFSTAMHCKCRQQKLQVEKWPKNRRISHDPKNDAALADGVAFCRQPEMRGRRGMRTLMGTWPNHLRRQTHATQIQQKNVLSQHSSACLAGQLPRSWKGILRQAPLGYPVCKRIKTAESTCGRICYERLPPAVSLHDHVC